MWRKIKQGKGKGSELQLYHFNRGPNREQVLQIPRGKLFQAEGTASAKARGGRHAWCV